MKFYMTPGSCSTGIHLLLEELGLVFEAHVVDLLHRERMSADFLSLNPLGTVPVLVRDDGVCLTGFHAIALDLAKSFPKRGLLPADGGQAQHARDVIDVVVDGIHNEGFRRYFVPESYGVGPEECAQVVRDGRRIAARWFGYLAAMMGDGPYVLPEFGIADAAAFYVEFWADQVGLDMPERCRVHYEAMLQRPAVRLVLAEEGYARVLNRHPAPTAARIAG